MFREAAELFGCEVTADDLYGRLFRKAMESKTDCKGMVVPGVLADGTPNTKSITAQAYWNGLSSNNVTEAYMYLSLIHI